MTGKQVAAVAGEAHCHLTRLVFDSHQLEKLTFEEPKHPHYSDPFFAVPTILRDDEAMLDGALPPQETSYSSKI